MVGRGERADKPGAVEDNFAGYTVHERDGEKIGKVDDLFLDESDRPEYVGVKMGFAGLSSTLVPMDAMRVDEGERALYVQAEKERVKDGPRFDDDNEITPDFERRVREYYGLSHSGSERGSYSAHESGRTEERERRETGAGATGAMAGDATTRSDGSGGRRPGMGEGDTGSGEHRGRLAENEDEVRVQRAEEELRAGVREREAGRVSVRKRVRTERERIAVPKRREEVTVDRVPVNESAAEGQIGDDEISVPIVEEEIVVEKRPVVKEEIRVRKNVVEDEEVVEEDVRKEEIDIDDASGATGRRTQRDI